MDSVVASKPRVRGLVAGKSNLYPDFWLVKITDNAHLLFRKNIRAVDIRAGTEIKTNDSVDFVVVKQGSDYLARDVALRR